MTPSSDIILCLLVLLAVTDQGSNYSFEVSKGASKFRNKQQITELPSGYYITEINSFKRSNYYRYHSTPTLGEGFLVKYDIAASGYPFKGPFRFQLWAATDTEGVFSYEGENVLPYENQYDSYSKHVTLNVPDADTLVLKPDYYIGYYVPDNKPVINAYHLPFQNSSWQYLAPNPLEISTIGKTMTFQPYEGGSQTLGFEYTVYLNEADLECEIMTLDSLNGEEFIEIGPDEEFKDGSKCWLVKMNRPCTSSQEEYIRPSIEIVEPKGCQDIYNFIFYSEGTKDNNRYGVQEMECMENRPIWKCGSSVCYFEYNVDNGRQFDYIKLRYFVNPEKAYISHDAELCDGEHRLKKASTQRTIGGVVSGVVVFIIIIIIVIVVAVKCNKKKPASNALNDPQAGDQTPWVITDNDAEQTDTQNNQPPPY